MSTTPGSVLRLGLALSLAAAASACFYDHRFTQQIVENRKRSKQAEGAAIAPRHRQRPIEHSGGVRLYVSTEYQAQHPAWESSLRDLIDQANAVLGAEFGVRLEVAGFSRWEPTCQPDRLDDCLAALRALDPAAPGQWVVGVMPASSRFTQSFDDLGIASLGGRHLVIRDVSDLVERAQIEAAFATLTSARRDEIYHKRAKHKRLSAFLHEWAHTLGITHAVERDSLMFSAYDDDMQRFDDTSAGAITRALPAQFAPAPVDGTRVAAAPEPSAPQPSSAQVPGLSASEQGDFQAAESLAQSDATAAYQRLGSLVERHPQSYPVQHLACNLLMQLGRSSEVQSVCTRAIALASAAR